MLNSKNDPFVYNIIPKNVFQSNLKFSDKLILSDIITAFNEGLPYFKSNGTLADLFKASKSTISRSFSQLIKEKWIKTNLIKDNQLRLVLSINVKKIFGEGVTKNLKSDFMDHKQFPIWIKKQISSMKKSKLMKSDSFLQKEVLTKEHKALENANKIKSTKKQSIKLSYSNHNLKSPNFKFKAIDDLLYDAFPNLDNLIRDSYKRKCINSWLNGNKGLDTPKFSMCEIEAAIDKAKKYAQNLNEPISNPLALVFNILQNCRREKIIAKLGKIKYQNKGFKASVTNNILNYLSSLTSSDKLSDCTGRELVNRQLKKGVDVRLKNLELNRKHMNVTFMI